MKEIIEVIIEVINKNKNLLLLKYGLIDWDETQILYMCKFGQTFHIKLGNNFSIRDQVIYPTDKIQIDITKSNCSILQIAEVVLYLEIFFPVYNIRYETHLDKIKIIIVDVTLFDKIFSKLLNL